MKIGILNTLTSNIKSVTNALDFLGYNNQYEIISEYTDKKFTHLILPGNGNYKSNMNIICKKKFDNVIKKHYEKNLHFLGICVGMQVLSTYGFETKKEKGLNIIPGEVIKIPVNTYRLPHIGWNDLEIKKNDSILKNINNKSSFYFLHSYFFNLKYETDLIAATKYESEIPVFIKKNNFYGVQFHPEKSQKNGLKLIKNFLKSNEN